MKKGNIRLIISLAVVALLYGGGCLIEHLEGTKSMVVTVLRDFSTSRPSSSTTSQSWKEKSPAPTRRLSRVLVP